MELKIVSSSNLAAVGYDDAEQLLVIKFKNGILYEYHNVSPSIYHNLLAAPSIGKYFNTVIRNKFAFTKLDFLEKNKK